ncbi:MAG: Chitinase family 18 [Patescibacteria group bacterium]|nr:Chitinase family 18 [Patescibacteria group bacterium]
MQNTSFTAGMTKKASALIRDNKLIILVSSIFIGWKFFLVSVFFNNEFSRSEESLIYIGHIDSVNRCSYIVFCDQFLQSFKTYYGFALLSYRVLFGAIGHLLNMNSSNVFHLSFYIGILMLLPALIFFLKNIETDKRLIAFLLFFLTLYNGGGSHGFWWVAPDFFASLIAFIAYAIILGDYKHWKMILAILMPVGFYFHTIFVYLMSTIVIFYFFYSFSTKNIHVVMLKKIVFSILILLIFYIPTSYYLGGNPYGPETFVLKSNIVNSGIQSLEKNISPAPSENSSSQSKSERRYSARHLFPGFNKIKERYFDYIFFEYNPFFIMIFAGVILILFHYKQYKILSMYFAALVFTLASSLNQHADRALPFIWPITFLLYGYGVWFAFQLSEEYLKENRKIKIAFNTFLYSGMVIFIVINIIYSYGVNQNIEFNPAKFLEDYVWNHR